MKERQIEDKLKQEQKNANIKISQKWVRLFETKMIGTLSETMILTNIDNTTKLLVRQNVKIHSILDLLKKQVMLAEERKLRGAHV